jgi:hypothetical protein
MLAGKVALFYNYQKYKIIKTCAAPGKYRQKTGQKRQNDDAAKIFLKLFASEFCVLAQLKLNAHCVLFPN